MKKRKSNNKKNTETKNNVYLFIPRDYDKDIYVDANEQINWDKLLNRDNSEN